MLLTVVAVLTLIFDQGLSEDSTHLLEISITGLFALGINAPLPTLLACSGISGPRLDLPRSQENRTSKVSQEKITTKNGYLERCFLEERRHNLGRVLQLKDRRAKVKQDKSSTGVVITYRGDIRDDRLPGLANSANMELHRTVGCLRELLGQGVLLL